MVATGRHVARFCVRVSVCCGFKRMPKGGTPYLLGGRGEVPKKTRHTQLGIPFDIVPTTETGAKHTRDVAQLCICRLVLPKHLHGQCQRFAQERQWTQGLPFRFCLEGLPFQSRTIKQSAMCFVGLWKSTGVPIQNAVVGTRVLEISCTFLGSDSD